MNQLKNLKQYKSNSEVGPHINTDSDKKDSKIHGLNEGSH
jgi:hypothetical protein